MIEQVPLPDLDEDSQPFWEAGTRGELVVQACADCGRLRMPPRPMCPYCRSLDAEWRLMSGLGTVWSYVVVHPPVLPAFNDLAPYNVVVVTLDEDPTIRIAGNVVARADGAINEVDPATIEIGQAVRIAFERVAGDVALPRWLQV